MLQTSLFLYIGYRGYKEKNYVIVVFSGFVLFFTIFWVIQSLNEKTELLYNIDRTLDDTNQYLDDIDSKINNLNNK